MKQGHRIKYIYTSTTYIPPLILIFCASRPIILFHMIIRYVFNNLLLFSILCPPGKLITRHTGDSLMRPQEAQHL